MSLKQNLISASLTDEEHTAVIDSLKAVEALLPFAVTLSKEDRLSLPKVGVKAQDFIDKAYEYALKNPTLVPAFLDMTEFGIDARLSSQLQVATNHMVPLSNKVEDTQQLVRAEAYEAALTFYQHIKTAARSNVPGAAAIAAVLSQTFKRSKTKIDEISTEEILKSTSSNTKRKAA